MNIFKFLKEVKAEMKHVSWPTRRQVISYSLLVIIVSIAAAIYLGAFDFLFTRGVEQIIQ